MTTWHQQAPSDRRPIRRRKPKGPHDWRSSGTRSGVGSRSRHRGVGNFKGAWCDEVGDGALLRRKYSGLIHRMGSTETHHRLV